MKTSGKKFEAFAATGIAVWEQAAKEELQGADPWKKLSRESQGVLIKPFYSLNPSAAPSFHLPTATGTFLGPRTWYNCPRVSVKSPVEANAEALEHLRQGADGLFFDLEDAVELDVLLKSIEWPICTLNFKAKRNTDTIARDLNSYIQKIKGPTRGALFGTYKADPPSHAIFHFVGHSIADSSPEAIANAMVEAYQKLSNRFRTHSSDVAFSIEIGTEFFLDAARLRAIRNTWNLLLEKVQAPSSPIFLHACSNAWTNPAYSPHGNMLKATTAAMAAILGGCDALTLDAEEAQNATMTRAARNIAIVLREESHFSKVADPLAGSYFVDDLTRQMTDQIWNKVQSGITS